METIKTSQILHVMREEIENIYDKSEIFYNEPMKKHTTFCIGGAAEVFVRPLDIKTLQKTLRLCKKYRYPFYIMGNGSNLLVSDTGYKGCIIQFGENFNAIKVKDNCIYAQSGALLSTIAKVALENNLTGMEFAAGIPGSIGGAAVMNAGAYDGEMQQLISTVNLLDTNGQEVIYSKEQMNFSYRKSIVKENQYIVTGVSLVLEKGNHDAIQEKQEEFLKRRKEKQPLNFASAGSTFKRPTGNFAGKLIVDAGLSGFAIGDAQISEKHCGFLINKGNATAKEMQLLIKTTIQIVQEKFFITLEPEVIFLGDFQ